MLPEAGWDRTGGGEEGEVFPGAKLVGVGGGVEDHRQARPRRAAVVSAEPGHSAGAGPGPRGQASQQSSLAAPVRPDQGLDLTRAHGQIYRADAPTIAVAAAKAASGKPWCCQGSFTQ